MKSALLVIDYINGILNNGCKKFAEDHPIVANTNKLIAMCRKEGVPIYFIRLGFDANYSHCPKYSLAFNRIRKNKLFRLGELSAEFINEIDYRPTDIVINKTAVSPFCCEGRLIESLRKNKTERLIFSGVATDNAINLGVREAHDMGFYTTIVEDACGASSEDFHRQAINLLEKIANEIVTTKNMARCN